MKRFEIITKTGENYGDIIKNIDGNTAALGAYYNDQLIAAEQNHTEILYFENIPFAELPSSNFQNITMIERTIMNFLREHDLPKKVCILCDNSDTARLYKVVYNLYYSETKADRFEDDTWD